jgi:tetratricopeptide (TPR) repeat protein
LIYLKAHLQGKDHFPEKRIKLDRAFTAFENDRAWIHLWQENWYTPSEQTIGEADYLIANGQLDEALESLENSPVSDDFYKLACFSKGKAHRELNQERLALKAFEEALAGNRLTDRQLDEALDYFFNKELPDLAAKTLNRLLASDPANPEYLITKALLQLRKGTGSSAVVAMNELEGLGIGSAELHYQAGLKVQDKYPDQALIYFSEAINSGTMDARYYFSRGILQCNHTQIESGLDDLAMSLDINPNQPELYLQRGELRHALGDLDGACHDWRKALQLGNAKATDLIYKYCRCP